MMTFVNTTKISEQTIKEKYYLQQGEFIFRAKLNTEGQKPTRSSIF